MQSNDGDGHAATQNVGSPPSPLSSTQGPTDTGPRWALHARPQHGPTFSAWLGQISCGTGIGGWGGVTRFSNPLFCPDGRISFFSVQRDCNGQGCCYCSPGRAHRPWGIQRRRRQRLPHQVQLRHRGSQLRQECFRQVPGTLVSLAGEEGF